MPEETEAMSPERAQAQADRLVRENTDVPRAEQHAAPLTAVPAPEPLRAPGGAGLRLDAAGNPVRHLFTPQNPQETGYAPLLAGIIAVPPGPDPHDLPQRTVVGGTNPLFDEPQPRTMRAGHAPTDQELASLSDKEREKLVGDAEDFEDIIRRRVEAEVAPYRMANEQLMAERDAAEEARERAELGLAAISHPGAPETTNEGERRPKSDQ